MSQLKQYLNISSEILYFTIKIYVDIFHVFILWSNKYWFTIWLLIYKNTYVCY